MEFKIHNHVKKDELTTGPRCVLQKSHSFPHTSHTPELRNTSGT